MMIKYIFFDLGDTILDMSISNKALSFGLKKVLPNKLPITELISKWKNESGKVFKYYHNKGEFYTIKKLQTISLKNSLSHFGINLSDKKLNDVIDDFWDYLIKNCTLFNDVSPMLSELSKNGYLLGLITDADEEYVTQILKQHTLNDILKIKIISSQLKIYKPDQAIFQCALYQAECQPNEAVYIGDSSIDIYGAKKLVFVTIRVNRNQRELDLSKIQPDFIVDNLSKISSIIAKI